LRACKVLVPLPAYGFDPSETAIPWKLLTDQGFEVSFSTPRGSMAAADTLMLSGKGLGVWKPVLRARQDALAAYAQMQICPEFRQPWKYEEVEEADYDALLLPGGHDKGVREYLESSLLQQLTANFFRAGKPVAAICHGVVLAARSIDPITGNSVLRGYKTTALLRSQELLAYQMTRWWLKDYYLTYPEVTVEDEVTAVLADAVQFHRGPNPLLRDDHRHLDRGFTVRDRNYLSARWPGDVYSFSLELAAMISSPEV
jgi:protease I